MKHNFSLLTKTFVAGLLLIPQIAFSQALEDQLVNVTSEGSATAASSAEASREIQSKAISGTARDQVIEIIGENRYQKNKQLVESRIVREAAKFIPFVQPGDPVKMPDGSWKMKVELKVSVGSLRKMVIDTGLLTDSDTPVTILPMVAFTDRAKSISYRWWMGDVQDEARKSVVEWASVTQLGLHKELMRQGFHLVLPMDGTMTNPIPPVFRVDRASSQDLKQLGDYLGVSMVLRGDLRVKDIKETPGAWQVQVRLEVVPVQGGRTVAEISRTFDTDAGSADLVVKKKLDKEISEMAKDLSAQVFEAWTRGTLAATTVRLAVRGGLQPKQLSEFRTQLTRSVRDIKAMRERVFEPGRVIYEVDFAASPEEFRDRIKALDLPGFRSRYMVDSQQGEGDGGTIPYTIEIKPKAM